MDNTNRHFKGQQRNEKLVYYTRKHWVVLVRLIAESIALISVVSGIIALGVAVDEAITAMKTLMIIVAFGITIWLHMIFMRFVNYFLEIVLVTNFRVIKLEKTLYIKNDKNVVDLHEIQDVKKFQHGIIPNLLNYGRLVIVVPTMIEPLILDRLPSPDKFFRKLNNAKRDYIHSRQQRKLKAISDTTRSYQLTSYQIQ